MLRYLLDTNFCIRAIRDRPAELRLRFNAEANALCISDVVLFELLVGAEKSAHPAQNRQVVESFAARLSVLPFDSAAAAHIVVTGNLREFERVEGLRSEDWIAGA